MNDPQSHAGSLFADRAAAVQALDLAMPMIQGAVSSRTVGDSGFLAIVIMDPALGPGDCDFEQAILLEHACGDPAAWDADYSAYAREKARVCWRTGRNGHEVRHVSPHLLRADDTGVWGGICHDGIVVGVSGANPWFDEAFGLCLASLLRAFSKQRALQAPEALRLHVQARP